MQEHANLMWSWNRDQKAKETHILSIRQDKARNQRDFPFHLKEEAEFMTICDLPSGAEVPMEQSKPVGRQYEKKVNKNIKQDDDYLKDI